MRLASLVLLAACSSSAPTSATPQPEDLVAARPPIDAAPAAVTGIDADRGPCLPSGAVLTALADELVRACVDWEEADPRDCYDVAPNGVVAVTPRDNSLTMADSYASVDDDGFFVEACVLGECIEIRPGLGKTLRVVAAELSPAGGKVVLVLHDGKRGAAMLELWDHATNKRIATANHKVADRDGVSYEVEYLGDAVLLTATRFSQGDYHGVLFSAGKQLTLLAELEGSLGPAVAIDGARAAVTLDERVAIVDLTSGATVTEADWRAVVRAAEDEKVTLTLASEGEGRFALGVSASEAGPLLGLAVGGADGKLTPYPVAICEAP